MTVLPRWRASRVQELLLGSCLSAVLLVGCGSSSTPKTSTSKTHSAVSRLSRDSAAQILIQSAAAMRRVKSFHMAARLTTVSSPVTRMALSGDLYAGHAYAMSVTEHGMAISVVLDGRTAYMRADYRFWDHYTHNEMISWEMRGHWFKAPPQSVRAFAKAVEHFNAAKLGACLGSSTAGVAVVGQTTVDGLPAIVLGDARNNAGHDTVAVAASGPPYPLQITAAGRQSPSHGLGTTTGSCGGSGGPQWVGTVALSAFNRVGPLRVPAHPIPNIRAYVRSLVSG